MSRRDERKAENRTKLLAAARKVFADKGLGEATARDIVRETDLASGTFYNYFRDKEDVFRAVLEEVSEKARAGARARRLEAGRSIEERLYGAYLSYFELVGEERELFQVLRRNAGVIAMMEDEAIFDAGVRELFEDLGVWVEEGLLRDEAAVELEFLATAMVGVGFQIATLIADRGEQLDADAAARFCTRLFLHGIRGLG